VSRANGYHVRKKPRKRGVFSYLDKIQRRKNEITRNLNDANRTETQSQPLKKIAPHMDRSLANCCKFSTEDRHSQEINALYRYCVLNITNSADLVTRAFQATSIFKSTKAQMCFCA
tara:strand:+ start:611 stop:958 length:348 start_codon:yes stop_codon:yes gene_type:complete